MGMPIIEGSNTTKIQAITDILESIALEEAAIAHILNAEGEKLQKIIANEESTTKDLLCANQSVDDLADTLTNLAMLIKSKTRLALGDKCYQNFCVSCSDYTLSFETEDGTVEELPYVDEYEYYLFNPTNTTSDSTIQVKTIPASPVKLTVLDWIGISVVINPDDTVVISYPDDFIFGGVLLQVDFGDGCTRTIVIFVENPPGITGTRDALLARIKELKWPR